MYDDSIGGDTMRQESLTMTVEQAAAALNISRGLAYQAARDGRIPAIRIGRRLLVPRRALERLLEAPTPLDVRQPGAQPELKHG